MTHYHINLNTKTVFFAREAIASDYTTAFTISAALVARGHRNVHMESCNDVSCKWSRQGELDDKDVEDGNLQ